MKDIIVIITALVALSPIAAQATIVTETITFDNTIASGKYNINASDFTGLGAVATFTLDTDNPTKLQIELTNTSIYLPSVFDSSDQLLTSISFDFDGIASITSGIVVVGPDSYSMNFDNVAAQLVAGDDASGEWGYNNSNPASTGMLPHLVTATGGNHQMFSNVNLDGNSNNLGGPQGGLATDPALITTTSGYIADTVVITIDLDATLTDLDFLDNGARVEFGSDAAFLPEPATMALLALGGLVIRRRK